MPADHDIFDLLVVGGGINGAGIARDAAGRGLKVLLVERADLAQATSSASSKLIHGGLRYLEQYAFRLVREALAERETLLAMAPHIIWPLVFALPHAPSLRPAWMIRAGLFLYDHLGGRRRLPGSRGVDLRRTPFGAGLRPELRKGFVYSDCWVDDARLVVLNARDAVARGAVVRTRTECVTARRTGPLWEAVLRDVRTGGETTAVARLLVNAAGPWADRVAAGVMGGNRRPPLRHVKGSHIVVPRVHDGDHALILQNDDRRVVFVIPYEGVFSLIGTTDVPVTGDPADAAIGEDEIAYLCTAVSRYLARPLAPADVVWSYAGVRPLYDDGSADPSAVTRDYVLSLEADGGPPSLHVYGGKITTYRRLAEHAMEKIATVLPGLAPAWTAGAPLPGGAMPDADFDRFVADLARRRPGLDAAWLRRLARRHGTVADDIIGEARSMADLGRHFGAALYGCEVDWLRRAEWAETADDVLWRRTKEGLHLDPAGRAAVAAYMA
ncbi:MAG: glycerol-3-phosphate dehydrogenase [Alphaproteobacteria bacterium]|nr:glycerol-3-phosphate dehydrogenase [Alphaproteobacteria bacterium]